MTDWNQVRDAFDRQVRQSEVVPEGYGIHRIPGALCWTTDAGASWGNCVVWTDLSADTADSAIERVKDYFAAKSASIEVEWKHYDYDQPADLEERLVAAGFAAEPREALVIGAADDVAGALERSLGNLESPVIVRRVVQEDWAGIGAAVVKVYGGGSRNVDATRAEFESDPEAMSVYVAQAPDGEIVSSAWIRFHAGTEFASLWGGSTVPQWRQRGIYRQLVAVRAREAADRGYTYLQVDASDNSRPILTRLGFAVVATTTPYLWSPASVTPSV